MCGSSSSFLDINEKEDIIRVFAHTHTTGEKKRKELRENFGQVLAQMQGKPG